MRKRDKDFDSSNETETVLTGGGRTAVARIRNIVCRETGPWAATVHSLLNHLEKVGFAGAPRVYGTGFDDKGRETLTFIDGDLIHPGPWHEDAFYHVGRLLRDLHQATSTFSIPDNAVWRKWHGRHLGGPQLTIGHCDTGPWNIIARNNIPVAFIDWEVAGPVDPLYDLAQCCWLNAQLHDDDVAEKVGLQSPEERARHLRLILDGYGLPKHEHSGFVDKMIEFAIHDAAHQAIEANITPETEEATVLWGITWRTRSASWMLRTRRILEKEID